MPSKHVAFQVLPKKFNKRISLRLERNWRKDTEEFEELKGTKEIEELEELEEIEETENRQRKTESEQSFLINPLIFAIRSTGQSPFGLLMVCNERLYGIQKGA